MEASEQKSSTMENISSSENETCPASHSTLEQGTVNNDSPPSVENKAIPIMNVIQGSSQLSHSLFSIEPEVFIHTVTRNAINSISETRKTKKYKSPPGTANDSLSSDENKVLSVIGILQGSSLSDSQSSTAHAPHIVCNTATSRTEMENLSSSNQKENQPSNFTASECTIADHILPCNEQKTQPESQTTLISTSENCSTSDDRYQAHPATTNLCPPGMKNEAPSAMYTRTDSTITNHSLPSDKQDAYTEVSRGLETGIVKNEPSSHEKKAATDADQALVCKNHWTPDDKSNSGAETRNMDISSSDRSSISSDSVTETNILLKTEIMADQAMKSGDRQCGNGYFLNIFHILAAVFLGFLKLFGWTERNPEDNENQIVLKSFHPVSSTEHYESQINDLNMKLNERKTSDITDDVKDNPLDGSLKIEDNEIPSSDMVDDEKKISSNTLQNMKCNETMSICLVDNRKDTHCNDLTEDKKNASSYCLPNCKNDSPSTDSSTNCKDIKSNDSSIKEIDNSSSFTDLSREHIYSSSINLSSGEKGAQASASNTEQTDTSASDSNIGKQNSLYHDLNKKNTNYSTKSYSRVGTILDETGHKYVGLTNQSMTCYLNSLIQTFYMTPEFRNGLFNLEFRSLKKQTNFKSVPYQLQKLFRLMKTSSQSSVETRDLTNSLGFSSAYEQQDVLEFCRFMLEALEKGFEDTNCASLIQKLYGGTIEDYVKCCKCKKETILTVPFLTLLLPIKQPGSREQAMACYITAELLNGDNICYCVNCTEKTEALKYLLPNKAEPQNDIPVSTELGFIRTHGRRCASDAAPHLSDEQNATETDTSLQGENLYELFSVIVHSGSAMGGHYFAYIKNLVDDRWLRFNDSSVSGATVADIESSFGGNYTSANAYMLAYRKIDCNNRPFNESDEFFAHLETQNMETETSEPRRKKNRKQRH